MNQVLTDFANSSDKVLLAGSEIVGQALDEGLDCAKAITTFESDQKVVVENKNISTVTSTQSSEISLEVIKDCKLGSASTNCLDSKSLKNALKTAKNIAEYSLEDKNHNFLGPSAHQQLDFLFENELATLSIEEMLSYTQEALAKINEDSRIALDRLEMNHCLASSGLFTSFGTNKSETQATLEWAVMGMAIVNNEVYPFDYDDQFTFTKQNALSKILQSMDVFKDKLLSFVDPIKAPSYKGAVLFSPRALEELLLDQVIFHANARNLLDKASHWGDLVGEQVLSSKISISDDPHNRLLQSATGFDMDGSATKVNKIVEDGKFIDFLYNAYTAKAYNKKSSATAGGPFGLCVNAGDVPLKSLQDGGTNVLVVDRFSGNVDENTGAFSGVAKASRIFKDGKDIGPVTETMISGNFALFKDSVLGVSKETEIVTGNFIAPWILVDGVSVSGN